MALQDILDRVTLTRRFVKASERIAVALEAQNALLLRIADHLAPVIPEPTPEEMRTSGPLVRNQAQLARLEEWAEDFAAKVGRAPTEDDIEEWLNEDMERQAQ